MKSVIVCKRQDKCKPLTYGTENEFEKYKQTDQTY